MPQIDKSTYATSREIWREWLRKNHSTEKRVFLIHYKRHTGKPFVSHRESIEEAICFGWIDTTIKRIDEDKFGRFFCKRTEKSRWSSATLGYARKLIKEGKMEAAGLKAYNEGLKKPVIDHGLPKNPDIPSYLKEALEKDKKAKENFNSFAPSYKRTYIYWVERAKLSETRQKRIKIIMERARQKKPFGR